MLKEKSETSLCNYSGRMKTAPHRLTRVEYMYIYGKALTRSALPFEAPNLWLQLWR